MNMFQRMTILIQGNTPFLSVLNNTVSFRDGVCNVTIEMISLRLRYGDTGGPTAEHLVIQSSNQESFLSNHCCPTVHLLHIPLR
jgi:hypothetical protein